MCQLKSRVLAESLEMQTCFGGDKMISDIVTQTCLKFSIQSGLSLDPHPPASAPEQWFGGSSRSPLPNRHCVLQKEAPL